MFLISEFNKSYQVDSMSIFRKFPSPAKKIIVAALFE